MTLELRLDVTGITAGDQRIIWSIQKDVRRGECTALSIDADSDVGTAYTGKLIAVYFVVVDDLIRDTLPDFNGAFVSGRSRCCCVVIP